ncbi:family 16 glycosylhydrolase [Pedobacter yulinensis]|nr:family 16 glycosylhydrolase [Pedobacter yulinensis]
MHGSKLLILSGLILALAAHPVSEAKASNGFPSPGASKLLAVADTSARRIAAADWRLVFSDEFRSAGKFNAGSWTYCERGSAAWTRYLTSSPDYVYQAGGNLVLRMDNAIIAGDAVPYHSGGIMTSSKFSIRYGKIEVRARFSKGKGSWPAIWMMPELPTAYGGWPNSGEIDIMEHVNNENVVHQTIHNSAVTNEKGASTATHQASYHADDYNTYGIVWNPGSIEFYVNGEHQYTYKKETAAGSKQWPFDRPFYIILNQAGAVGWPGPANNADLPFEMKVDWVRVYKQQELPNPGFEQAGLGPWQAGAGAKVVRAHARSGGRAVRLKGGASILAQTIGGLLPNTTYTFGGYVRTNTSSPSLLLGVKNYGGSPAETPIAGKKYQHGLVTFTTGAQQTSATVYISKPEAGTAYADDFYLNKQ